MKLPTYSSTALPQKATISPAEAGAAAAAKYQFAADVAGEVSEFALKMQEAEDRTQARKQDADASYRLNEFINDPRWEQDEIDGRPTEQVMAEEYDLLVGELQEVGQGIASKEVQDQTRTQIRGKVENVGLQVRSMGNGVRIRRTKAVNSQTIDAYRRAGDWQSADDVVREAYEVGVYTTEERDSLLKTNEKLRRLTPYIDSLGNTNEYEVEAKALEALTDKTLDPDERVSMWRTLSSAADGIAADEYRARNERWSQNSVALWRDLPVMSVADIEMMDVSPEQKVAAIRQKRAASSAAASFDDASTVREAEELILTMYTDPNATVDYVAQIISGYAASGGLSTGTALDLQKKAQMVSEDVFKGSNFNDVRQQGILEITKGVPLDSMYDFFGDNASRVAAIQAEWSAAMMTAKMEEGPQFNPRTFYKENIDEFRGRVDEIDDTPEEIISKLTSVPMTGDSITDFTSINERINEVEARRRSGSLEDEQADAAIRKLAELRNLQ